jgi:hypothetical protein
MKIVGYALAIMYFFVIPVDFVAFNGLFFMLRIIMVAASGVPGQEGPL